MKMIRITIEIDPIAELEKVNEVVEHINKSLDDAPNKWAINRREVMIVEDNCPICDKEYDKCHCTWEDQKNYLGL